MRPLFQLRFSSLERLLVLVARQTPFEFMWPVSTHTKLKRATFLSELISLVLFHDILNFVLKRHFISQCSSSYSRALKISFSMLKAGDLETVACPISIETVSEFNGAWHFNFPPPL
jgi:hypothetical protein